MTATIIRYEGGQDAIRFGWITFGQRKRSFLFDRLSGRVRLFTGEGPSSEEDTDPARRDRARVALVAREPLS